jgi:dsRNA-specific ribonuclease
MDFRSYIKNLLEQADIKDQKYLDKLTEPEPLSVFQRSFTSPTFDPVNNYQVLEFIGDGIIKGINSQHVVNKFTEELKKFPSKSGTDEGNLSKARKKFEQKNFLYPIALSLNMWEYVRADEQTKETNRNKTLEDVIEAFIGALVENVDRYIYDGFGYMYAKKFMVKQLNKTTIEITAETLDDPVTRLNELYKANVIKSGEPLKWGDAVYEEIQMFLPKFNDFKNIPKGYKKDDMVYITPHKKAYFFNGNRWIPYNEIPLGIEPKEYDFYGLFKNTPKYVRQSVVNVPIVNEFPISAINGTTIVYKNKAFTYHNDDWIPLTNIEITNAVKINKNKINIESLKDKIQLMSWMFVYGKPKGENKIVGQGLAFENKGSKMTAAKQALEYLKQNYGLER